MKASFRRKISDEISEARSIAVFRALQLEDLLCAIPTFRAIRKAAPQARTTLVGLPWAKSFVGRYAHLIDDFLEFPGFPELHEQSCDVKAVPRFLETAQRRNFDLAVQLHGGSAILNPIVFLLGARKTAGFYMAGDVCPDPQTFMPYPAGGHEIRRLLRLVEFLGLPTDGDDLELPIFPADVRELTQVAANRLDLEERFVCIHVGSRNPTRRWLPERFAAVAERLVWKGFQVVLTGNADELSLVNTVSRRIHAPHVNLVGQTSFGTLAALLVRSSLVICSDPAISHMASAVKTQGVVITTASDPVRWAPLDHRRNRAVFRPIVCRPCQFTRCPIGQPCATGISVDTVLGEALDILEIEHRDPAPEKYATNRRQLAH